MTVQIPITTAPNQFFDVTLPINGINKTVTIELGYLSNAGYWVMSITDTTTKAVILSALPLVTGVNTLGQFQHLGIGSAAIIKASDILAVDADNTNLGTDFLLVWGDNIG